MGLISMAFRRVRKLVAWVLAVTILMIGVAGVIALLHWSGVIG